MKVETFVLATPPVTDGPPLSMTAKKYTYGPAKNQNGITLLMLHGLGQHKEQWEPVIEKLYALQLENRVPRIREVWSFDWQSHGESAILNADVLKENRKSAPMARWSSAIASFITSDSLEGHRLVGIGYSSGTMALMGSTLHFEKCPYVSIILVEPSIMDQETWDTHQEKEIQPAFDMMTKAVMRRRDSWTSREEARKYFIGRFPWNSWDSRIVGLFVKHALKDSKDKDGSVCVVRACPAIHEATAFEVNRAASWDAAGQVSKLSGIVPIHAVFGEKIDLMPQPLRDCVLDESKGRKMDSITMIPGVGHTVVQSVPDIVGSTIWDLLQGIESPKGRSHL
ncbi:Alpha/beta hydrolase fold-1 [Mycena crocata]|nr:Alpha/beta hydrolase fold-1 [Mycena crocata]